jgi:hypothetical protein
MRRSAFVIVTSVLATLASMLLVALSTFTAAISRADDFALVVPGTGNPTPDASFVNAEVRNFVTPTNPACASSCTQIAVNYPASFWPIILFGLKQLFSDTWNVSVQTGVDNLGTKLAAAYSADRNGHFYLVGYSQGATVGSYFKKSYPAFPQAQGLPPPDQVTFVLAANPNRPNGGLFERPGIFGPFRIPILDATVGIPAPTDTGVRTTDIAIQYDGVSDFPEYPINLLADANAIAGLLFIHRTYVFPNANHPTLHPYGYTVDQFTAAVTAAQEAADQGQCTEAAHCQQFGDTTYITLPTIELPILAPVNFLGEQFGLSQVTTPLTDLIQPVMTVLIETGFNRTSYGTPTPFQLIPNINPVTLSASLLAASVQGINDAVGDVNGTRPAPAPTQDPFATAVSLFTDPPAPSSTPPGVLAPQALTANLLSTSAPPKSGTPSTTSTTGTTSSTINMTTGAKFTPGTSGGVGGTGSAGNSGGAGGNGGTGGTAGVSGAGGLLGGNPGTLGAGGPGGQPGVAGAAAHG